MGTEAVELTEANGAEADQVPSDLEKQIIRQIEYYFGDYNLTKDKFLREQLKVDDGWVPLETMVKFNRLKQLSTDFNVICEALKKSAKKIMEVSEDSTKIRRYNPSQLPEDLKARQKDLDEKTLYVKGFRKDNTLDDLLDFFKDFGVENIFMRRIPKQGSRPFKGSVFVTFDSKDDAEKFLNEKGIKYKGTELLKEWKVDYVKRKDEFYQNLRQEKAKKMEAKLKSKKDGDAGNQEDSSALDEDAEGSSENMVRDCLLKLENLGKECDREQIKEAFQPLGNLVYVDYHHGLASATIRFDSAVASSVFEKIPEEDGKRTIKIGSSVAEVSLIEGDKEEEYWKHISVSRKRSREMMRQKQGRSQGNRGRQKWQGKSRGQQQWKKDKRPRNETKVEQEESQESPEKDESQPPEKKIKTDPEESKIKFETTDKEDESQPPEKKIKTDSKESKRAAETTDKDETEQPRKKVKVESSGETSSEKLDNAAQDIKQESKSEND